MLIFPQDHKVVLLAATNLPWALDAAFKRRYDLCDGLHFVVSSKWYIFHFHVLEAVWQ